MTMIDIVIVLGPVVVVFVCWSVRQHFRIRNLENQVSSVKDHKHYKLLTTKEFSQFKDYLEENLDNLEDDIDFLDNDLDRLYDQYDALLDSLGLNVKQVPRGNPYEIQPIEEDEE